MRAFGWVILAFGLAPGAEAIGQEAKAKLPKAHLVGTITEVKWEVSFGSIGWFRADCTKETDPRYKEAGLVIIAQDDLTKVFHWQDGKKTPARHADLKVGCEVRVVFHEPLGVNTAGREILILKKRAPKK